MADYDPETVLRRAVRFVGERKANEQEAAATVAFLAMALTVAISEASDPDGAEALALEAGDYVELQRRTQPEPESGRRG